MIGSQILVSRVGLGRNPKIWDEPNTFKPERHLDGHVENSLGVTLIEPDMRFVTFGTGRRSCPGTKIGTSMTIMLLARLLQGFEWTLPNGKTQVELISAESNLFMAKPLLACANLGWLQVYIRKSSSKISTSCLDDKLSSDIILLSTIYVFF
ncbi:LOW QUALITY PROTEIN: cytochrome P450 79B1 [Arabidopsis lyrata subsp. lyrata]|uniref:LOW QUALITY PROTEIN: cytochrome P450 79B1 n=1 Tax=Arabidopsis lyrata subsp. lyrata TaxID=81972 RepID=UPI000A29E24C|nr:LOW QUALITY PROTEIN: cytochrome P450 79B1 [Arabidopsis lyrata subsp. lyrata]|eukprot:XP_020865614.1 LOW QUALITY PROTEIN: cytochrome P450 79B1 [Arabidopsis lyrata subsp. lyrata]